MQYDTYLNIPLSFVIFHKNVTQKASDIDDEKSEIRNVPRFVNSLLKSTLYLLLGILNK